MARASSPKLNPIFEMGSGDGVTAARTAVLPPCAANAMRPPSTGGEELFARRKLGRGCIGQQSRDGNTHKRVERIPDQVKGWNFVRKEFDDEQDDAGCNDPPAFEQTERVGERQHTKPREQTQRANRRIDV